MKPREATFVKSATNPSHYPPPTLPEIAIAGRSNVGKSSLINSLVVRPKLAKTSNTPGRTRLLNWFEVVPARGKPFHLVNLPGYGYAKVPRQMRKSWEPMIVGYLSGRSVLRGVVLLVDARRGALQDETDLIDWLRAREIATLVAITKIDKLPKSKRKLAREEVRKSLGGISTVSTSATSSEGMGDLWQGIARLLSDER